MTMCSQVGFHVEGVPPSPAQEATLAEQHLHAGAKVAAGSPSPVIIPPTFQVAERTPCRLCMQHMLTSPSAKYVWARGRREFIDSMHLASRARPPISCGLPRCQ